MIKNQLLRDEGNVPHAYQDHLGFWTIGVGFLIDERKGGGLLPEEIDFILENRIKKTKESVLKKLPWVADLSEARKAVFYNMAYQLGLGGLLGFKNFIRLAKAEYYELAANEMLDSRWAKQTPSRAKRLSKQMLTNEWVL